MTASPTLVAGRYRLIEPLGVGGMGRVWHAWDEILGRAVAAKEIIPPEELLDTERDGIRRRTLREARAAARLSHPNVVRVYDVFESNARPWIVMEYVPSRSLMEVISDDGPMPPQRVALIGLGVLAALRAAHRAGVMHRDVKPSNVLLADDGRVVLTDFGIATLEGDATVTRTGLVLGSPAYIAPERAREGIAGPASDLWSLGATLYAAVEGRSPYERASALATLTALASEEPDPTRRAGALRPVLNGLLRKDPAARIDALEAERRLRRAAAGGGSNWRIRWPWLGKPEVAARRTPLTRPSGGTPTAAGTRNAPSAPSTPGTPGVSGASGASSAPGTPGVSGASGASSAPSTPGVSGASGTARAPGVAGIRDAGASGVVGASGAGASTSGGQGPVAPQRGTPRGDTPRTTPTARGRVRGGAVSGPPAPVSGAPSGQDPSRPASVPSQRVAGRAAVVPASNVDTPVPPDADTRTGVAPDPDPAVVPGPHKSAPDPVEVPAPPTAHKPSPVESVPVESVPVESVPVESVPVEPEAVEATAGPVGAEAAEQRSVGFAASEPDSEPVVETSAVAQPDAEPRIVEVPAVEVPDGEVPAVEVPDGEAPDAAEPLARTPEPEPEPEPVTVAASGHVPIARPPANDLDETSSPVASGEPIAAGAPAPVEETAAVAEPSAAVAEPSAAVAEPSAAVAEPSAADKTSMLIGPPSTDDATRISGTAARSNQPTVVGGSPAIDRVAGVVSRIGSRPTRSGAGPTVQRTPALSEPVRASAAVAAGVPRTSVGRRGPSRTVLIIVVVLVLVLLAGIALIVKSMDDDSAEKSAGQTGTSATATPSAPARTTPQAQPSATTASPSVTAASSTAPSGLTGERPPLTDGWRLYTDDSGFSMYVPAAWSRYLSDDMVYFRDPNSARLLGIGQTNEPKPDPVQDWRNQSTYRVNRGDFPGYQEIRIEKVPYFLNAADWEFTWNKSGTRIHVNDRGFIVATNKAYGIWFQAADSDWSAANDEVLKIVFESFRSDFARP